MIKIFWFGDFSPLGDFLGKIVNFIELSVLAFKFWDYVLDCEEQERCSIRSKVHKWQSGIKLPNMQTVDDI